MSRFGWLILGLLCSASLAAQDKIYIHKKDNISLGAPITITDSVYFGANGNLIFFRIGGKLEQYSVSDIDSLSFGAGSDTVLVNYSGSKVSVLNPLAFEGGNGRGKRSACYRSFIRYRQGNKLQSEGHCSRRNV